MWQALTGRKKQRPPPVTGVRPGATLDGGTVELVPPGALLGERLRHQLTAMRFESGLPEEEFKNDVRGPILACAEWVQQLPGSRNESHCEAGGLVRLAVECAAVALRRADGKVFHAPGQGVLGGVQHDTAWRHAAILGALFVIVGRGVARWRVSSEDGRHTWNPYVAGLHQWVPSVGGCHYRVRSAPPATSMGRAGAAAWLAAQCLESGQLTRLQHGDGRIMGALMDVLGGHKTSMLGEIVEDARVAVICEDMNRVRQHPGRPPARLEQQVLSVIRGLVQDRWTVNSSEGRVWVGRGGVYLAWQRAAEDIRVRMRAEYEQAPDLDAIQLAALLLKHGLVEPNPNAGGKPRAEMELKVTLEDKGMQAQMTCVRLTDPRIFALHVEGVAPVPLGMADAEAGRPAEAKTAFDQEPPPIAEIPEWIQAADAPPDREKGDVRGRCARARPKRARASREKEKQAAEHEPRADGGQGEPLPALARYGEVGRVLSHVARAPGRACTRMDEGVALPYSALKGQMSPKAFLEQCRIQAILVEDKPRAGEVNGPGPREPYILLAPHLAKAMGVAGPDRRKA